MPEAVIVAVTRSPIGRARKGSLAGMRPDDLAARMVRAALDRVPAPDLLGLGAVPGTTVTRCCSSSVRLS